MGIYFFIQLSLESSNILYQWKFKSFEFFQIGKKKVLKIQKYIISQKQICFDNLM